MVHGVRFYVVLNSDGRAGYSGGSGGTLRVALAPDSGGRRHVPARRSLASATLDPPTRDAWPLVSFRKPARVVAGRYYYVVFTNLDPDPRRNYVSVNALVSRRPPRRGAAGPDGLGGAAVRRRGTAGARRADGSRGPSGEATAMRRSSRSSAAGADQHLGVGYMEVWVEQPQADRGPGDGARADRPDGGSGRHRRMAARAPPGGDDGSARAADRTRIGRRARRRDGAGARGPEPARGMGARALRAAGLARARRTARADRRGDRELRLRGVRDPEGHRVRLRSPHRVRQAVTRSSRSAAPGWAGISGAGTTCTPATCSSRSSIAGA